MGIENDNIIYGPEFKVPIPECSLAEYLIPKMKSLPRDNSIQVDSETGISQTVGELMKLSFGITEGLLKIGLKVNDMVALVSKNRSETYAAALGIIWSGGVTAPIDPRMKVYELRHMFGLIQPKYVFTEVTAVENVENALNLLGITAKIILIDPREESNTSYLTLENLITEVDIEAFEPRPIKSPKTQLVIATPSSGTTGLPKEVGLTHQNIIFQLASWQYKGNSSLSAPCLQFTPLFWFSGMRLLLLSATTGAKRIFLKQFTYENILKAIHTYKPVWMTMTPSVMAAVMKHPDFKKYDVSSIKFILLGGNAVSEHLINRIKEEWNKDAVTLQYYGQTELTGAVTDVDPTPETTVTDADPIASFLSVKLGPGIELKVMDLEAKKALGPNQIGELCFKSKGMMKCYVGNPEETKQAIDNEGWCHSGDIGYYDEKQNLFIVDRIKELIVVKHEYVSPAQLETLIETIPGVLEAGVVGIPNEQDFQHPMALVVKRSCFDVTESDIVGLVKDTLSDAKQLRAGVVFVDSIPRTATGKIKRPLLKEMAISLYNRKKM